jgi:hypothetical protein
MHTRMAHAVRRVCAHKNLILLSIILGAGRSRILIYLFSDIILDGEKIANRQFLRVEEEQKASPVETRTWCAPNERCNGDQTYLLYSYCTVQYSTVQYSTVADQSKRSVNQTIPKFLVGAYIDTVDVRTSSHQSQSFGFLFRLSPTMNE